MAKPTKVQPEKNCAICNGNGWKVVRGKRPPKHAHALTTPLFVAVGEKLPYETLKEVRRDIKKHLKVATVEGVYLAHDSVGVARYAGRGKIFARLHQHQMRHPSELKYFSFYVMNDKIHEKEIETLCIRVAGPQLLFNTQKKREDIRAGSVRDWEAGTLFYKRQRGRGKEK